MFTKPAAHVPARRDARLQQRDAAPTARVLRHHRREQHATLAAGRAHATLRPVVPVRPLHAAQVTHTFHFLMTRLIICVSIETFKIYLQ